MPRLPCLVLELALPGNIHVLKHVEWKPQGGDAPTAAELLVRRGVGVFSVLQKWPGECSDREPVLREPNHPEGQGAVAEAFAPMAARVPSDPTPAAEWGGPLGVSVADPRRATREVA